MSHFNTHWKSQKTSGFRAFSGCIEMDHWPKMGWSYTIIFPQFLHKKLPLPLHLPLYHLHKEDFFSREDVYEAIPDKFSLISLSQIYSFSCK